MVPRTEKRLKLGIAAVCGLVFAVELFAGTQFDPSVFWFPAIFLLGLALGTFSLRAHFRGVRLGLVGFFVGFLACGWALLSFAPGGDRIIGRMTTQDGTEVLMLHRHTGDWADPYFVSFCYRKSGGLWKEMLYERGGLRWWFGSIRLEKNGQRAVIRRFLLPVAYFDIVKEDLTVVRWGATYSGYTAAKGVAWTPEEELLKSRNAH